MKKQNYDCSLPINAWAEEDRPREKLLQKGRSSLSDAELLAIILGSGSRYESAVSLAQRILSSVDFNLNTLSKMNVEQLVSDYKGVGQAKAISIIAVAELGLRRQQSSIPQRPTITSSRDAYTVVGPSLRDLPHEEFWVLILNKANKVLSKKMISRGGTSSTIVDAKIIFSVLLRESGSSGLILVHNHPSGQLKPSQADIKLTTKLYHAAKIMDFVLLDHLIIGDDSYYSFADEGMLTI